MFDAKMFMCNAFSILYDHLKLSALDACFCYEEFITLPSSKLFFIFKIFLI